MRTLQTGAGRGWSWLVLATLVALLSACGGSSSTTGGGTAATLVSIQVTPAAATIAKGTTEQYTATGTYSDNSTKDLTPTVTWTSNSTGVATLSAAALATGMATGTANITATSGTVTSNSAVLTVTAATLLSLVVTPPTASIAASTTQQFTATGTYSDGSTQDLTASASWGSSNSGVAAFGIAGSTPGLATGVAAGTATITATAGTVTSNAASLTVTTATLVSIAVTPTTASIATGTTQQFTAIGTYSDSSTPDLTASASWGSSNTAVATFSTAGLATGAAQGTSNITATFGGITSNAGTLTVTAAALASIQITPATATVLTGLTQQYAATGTFTDGSTQSLTALASWHSDATSLATFSVTGLATGIAAGTANITATFSGITSNTATLAVSATLTAFVGNLRNLGVTHSGFVIGSAGGGSGGVATVEVSLDNVTSYAPANGTNAWSFKLPTGTNTWKDGSAHTIYVRARDGSNNLSPVVTVNVRKGVNQDVNGDGYGDVVVGSAYSPTGAGVVYVYHGSATGVSSTANATLAQGSVFGYYGGAVALGDVNGDGYADVAVGAPLQNSNAGVTYVYHGSATGVVSPAHTILTGSISQGRFGGAVALGDVNGDGYADLAVGEYTSNSNAGYVFVFHGSATGVASGTDGTYQTFLSGPAGGYFGNSVALGDVNGDGYADLAVGAFYAGLSFTYTGAAYVFHGSSSGVASAAYSAANSTLTGPANSYLGGSVALGDVNADGYADLAVGMSSDSPSPGTAYIFHGSSSGVPTAAASAANTTLTGLAWPTFFGSSLSLLDVNGDGYPDLVAGGFFGNGKAGAVYVFHASSTGVASAAYSAADAALSLPAGIGTYNPISVAH